MKHLDEIFRLADLDKKDLTQKALKLCEEAGEVAQAVLSYTKAPVCGYKNKNQGDILEEVSDVIIVALSIARKLELSKEDINTVIENKLAKWEKKINDSKRFTINFKVADNISVQSDIMNYYVTGDSAPIGRFNYTYNAGQ